MGAGLCWGRCGEVVGVVGCGGEAAGKGEELLKVVAGNLDECTVYSNVGRRQGSIMEYLHIWSLCRGDLAETIASLLLTPLQCGFAEAFAVWLGFKELVEVIFVYYLLEIT
nr:hypothetical protein [Tanacetum cinerariifolium]